MLINSKILVLAGVVTLSACGAVPNEEQAEKKKTAEAGETGAEGAAKPDNKTGNVVDSGAADFAGFALTDEEKDDVAAQVEEAMETVSEEVAQEDDGADGGLLIKRKIDAKFLRNCDEKEDGSAVVTVDRSIDRSLDVSTDNASGSREKSRKLNLTRVWEKDGQDIRCHMSRKFVDLLSIQGLNGLKISGDFSRSISRDLKHSDGRYLAADYKATGERSVSFATQDSEEKRILTATIESDVKRSYTRMTKDGNVALESRIRTDDEFPLVIVAETSSNKLFRWPDSVEIASGKVILERANGTLIETQFAKVKIDFSKGLCQRRSGDITGSVKRADGSVQSYNVDFDEKSLLIRFADGSEKRLAAVACAQ